MWIFILLIKRFLFHLRVVTQNFGHICVKTTKSMEFIENIETLKMNLIGISTHAEHISISIVL